MSNILDWIIMAILALLVTALNWFRRVASTTAQRAITFSRAVTRNVCVSPYCKDRGDHSSHS